MQLRYCLERLKSGGQIFVFEHNPYNPITRHLVNTCSFDADAVLLTRRETIRRLTKAGFQISSAGYCLFFPQILSALRPLEPSSRMATARRTVFCCGNARVMS